MLLALTGRSHNSGSRSYIYYRNQSEKNPEAVMYLRDKGNGDLVEVLDVSAMVDPCRDELPGRYHAGEELQDPATFRKSGLTFPSGEELPRCWVDAGYKDSTA
jgi:hypothetical protein